MTEVKDNIPDEIKNKVFQCKSVAVYEKWHNLFLKFLKETDRSENFESIVVYFNKLSESYAPSSEIGRMLIIIEI